ncbi:MAG: tetratricopeptide repeat protein [Endomicrobiales bacterium]|nr:tetratricopeptide repeat protein [Endomicrobiales bacterium]
MHEKLKYAILIILIITTIFLIDGNVFAADKPKVSSLELFQRASKMFETNKEACIKQFQIFIKQFPRDDLVPEAEFMIAECLYDMDPKSSEALKKFQRITGKYQSHPQAQSAALSIAEIYYNDGDYRQSLDVLEKAESKYKNGYLIYEIRLLKAQCYVILKDCKKAQELLQEIVKKQPAYNNDKRFNYVFGLANFELGEYETALENLEKVESPESLLFQSKILIQLKKPLFSVEKLRELINKYPDNEAYQERAYYHIGEAFFFAEDYISAINTYEKFLQLFPQSVLRGPAIFKIGCSYLKNKSYLLARSNFQSFLQIDSKSEFSPLALYLIGESFLTEKRYKEASFAYADTVSSFHENRYAPVAQYKLAWCYYKMGKMQDAKASLVTFKQMFAADKLLPQVELLLGNVLSNLEKYDDAVLAYQRAIDATKPSEFRESAFALMSRANYLNGNDAALVSGYHYLLNNFPLQTSSWRLITYLYIAEGFLKQGLYKEANELYSLIKSHYPADPLLVYAQDGAAWAYFLSKDYLEANKLRDKIQTNSFQENADEELTLYNRYELANTLFNRKEYLKALSIFEDFYRNNPGHSLAPSAAFRAGLSYYQLEYFGQAIDIWEEIARKYPQSPEASKALWKVADTYFRAQHYDKCIQTYTQIIEKYAKDKNELAQANLRIAQCYYNSKSNTLAVKALKELIENFTDEPEAKDALDFLTALLDVPEAESLAVAALNNLSMLFGYSNAISIEIRFRLAKNKFENKKYNETIDILESTMSELEKSDKFADSNYYLANSYYKLERYNDAANAYKRFVENFPGDSRIQYAYFYLASSYFKIKEYELAAQSFEALAQKYPDTEFISSALYNAAMAYKETENWEKAASILDTYRKKHAKKEDDFELGMQIASMYEEQHQYLRAIECFNENRQKVKNDSEEWKNLTFRIAENYHNMDDYQNAEIEYKKLVSRENIDNWSLNAMIRLGEYYENRGQTMDALALYQELYSKASKMNHKPDWLDAVKARISALKIKINSGQ